MAVQIRGFGTCAYCNKELVLLARGLCQKCYNNRRVRKLFPTQARRADDTQGLVTKEEKKYLPRHLWKNTNDMTAEELEELIRIKTDENNVPEWWESARPPEEGYQGHEDPPDEYE